MRNVPDKSCRENQNTHFVFNNFFSDNRAVYDITWKNMVQPGRPQMKIWRMRIACRITNATRHTFRIRNTYFFCTAPLVTLTRLNITLHLHCLACYMLRRRVFTARFAPSPYFKQILSHIHQILFIFTGLS